MHQVPRPRRRFPIRTAPVGACLDSATLHMATVYKKAGNDEAAERTYREAIARLTKKLGPEHPDLA
jgi:hypothetical protein